MIRLIFNCDDFGKTHEVNTAVLKAHQEGILGSASLMVTGNAFSEAVEIARTHPSLKVGLHLALNDAQPVLPKEQIPNLVDPHGRLHQNPGTVGLRIAFCPRTRAQARAEIAAQFDRFAATGLPRSHVDGHHHLHMHPFVLRECIQWAERLRFTRIRVAREFGNPLPPRRDSKKFIAKLFRHWTFLALAAFPNRLLSHSSLQKLDGVLGLWETGRMNENYLLQTIPKLPAGNWEIYTHLGSKGAEEELPALLSLQLKELLQQRGIAYL